MRVVHPRRNRDSNRIETGAHTLLSHKGTISDASSQAAETETGPGLRSSVQLAEL